MPDTSMRGVPSRAPEPQPPRRCPRALPALLPLLSVATMAGCGSGEPAGPEFADLDGTWDAEVTVTGGGSLPTDSTFPLTLTIEQAGVGFTGRFSAGEDREGRIAGSLTSREIEMQLVQEEPCTGTFTTTAVVSVTETEMAGLIAGSDCGGNLEAEFFGRKR